MDKEGTFTSSVGRGSFARMGDVCLAHGRGHCSWSVCVPYPFLVFFWPCLSYLWPSHS